MGFTYVTMTVCNPLNVNRNKKIKFLVDTGAFTNVVPENILQDLGIKPVGIREFKVFGGKFKKREIGSAIFKYNGDITGTEVTFGKRKYVSILGVTALESLGYIVNPKTGKLKKTDLFILYNKR